MARINMRGVIRRMGAIRDFERVTATFGDNGRAVEAAEPFKAQAIVQPAGKDDLELLEEGQRFFPTILIHIIKPLTVGDYINYRGDRWKVVNAQDWSDYGFHRCIAIRPTGTEKSNSEGFTVT